MNNDPTISQRLLATRMIASALMSGLVLLGGVVLFLVHGTDQKIGGVGGFPIISAMAIGGFVLVGGSLLYIVPALNRGQLQILLKDRQGVDSAPLVSAWTTSVTVLYGLLEGPALFGLIAYLLEHQLFVLAVPGLSLLLMLAFFPSDARFQAWLDRQRAALEELKRREGPG